MIRSLFFLLVASLFIYHIGATSVKAAPCTPVTTFPYTLNAENFTLTLNLNNGQPELGFMNKKDMMNMYYVTFMGIQEATPSNTSGVKYDFTGNLMNGQAWTLCTAATTPAITTYTFTATPLADKFTSMMLMGTVDTTMNMTAINFPVTKPNFTIDGYQWTDTTATTMLAASYMFQWSKSNVMQTTDNQLYNEQDKGINWEDAYFQTVMATDSLDTMVPTTVLLSKDITNKNPNLQLGFVMYGMFATNLKSLLDLGFGATDKTPTNGSGWKIIVSIAVVAVVAVVAIALLGFCLLRRRGRNRYHRV